MKLLEIFAHLRIEPASLKDSICAELGSAPGGWTWILLLYGCKVLSMDWAEITSPHVASHPNIIHLTGDASQWMPCEGGQYKKFDWLFCDMSLPPMDSLLILERWIQNEMCKNFVWTLKFSYHPSSSVSVLLQMRQMLAKYNYCKFITRHLHNHGKEVVILGKLNA